MEPKDHVCCFTGHRVIAESEWPEIEKRLEDEITTLIHQGVTEFRAGGALGFDTMAAIAVLRLRKQYKSIRLVLVLPYWEQSARWSAEDRERYRLIRMQADEVIYTSWIYHSGCLYKRNRRLVNDSGVCVCYLTKASGGTAYTVGYAKQKGVEVVNIALY